MIEYFRCQKIVFLVFDLRVTLKVFWKSFEKYGSNAFAAASKTITQTTADR